MVPTARPVGSPDTMVVRAALSEVRLPSPRSRAVVLDVGNRILVCGGLTSSGTTTGSILAIDFDARRVSAAGVMSTPVHDAGGGVLDGVGFVFGGGKVVADSVVQQVDPARGTTLVGQLPSVRADLGVATLAGELLVIGGGTPAGPDPSVLATTDGHTFTTVATLKVGVRYPAVAVVDGLVYVIGGSTPAGDSNVIQTIDPRTNKVRIAGHLPRGLSHASAFVVGGILLAAGGQTAGHAQAGLWQVDTATGLVARVGHLPYAVSDAAAVVQGGTGYLIGGEGAHRLATIIEVSAG